MRLLGLILLIGGFLIWMITPFKVAGWIVLGLGALILIFSFLTKRK